MKKLLSFYHFGKISTYSECPEIKFFKTCLIHPYQIPFKNFSATSASNGGLIEWKIALFHKKIFLADQRTFDRWRQKN